MSEGMLPIRRRFFSSGRERMGAGYWESQDGRFYLTRVRRRVNQKRIQGWILEGARPAERERLRAYRLESVPHQTLGEARARLQDLLQMERTRSE